MATPNLSATLESYVSPSLIINPSSTTPSDKSLPALHLLPSSTLSKLRNVGPARMKDMRLVLGHSRQIISHIPISASPQACARCNDALYTAIRLNADKFAGLALLPGGKGEGREAARELQRCVSKYGFVGGAIGLKRGDGGEGLVDDGTWEEVWGTAAKCRVPIVLRELWPLNAEIPDYQCNLPDTVLAPLLTHIHTSHSVSPLPLLHIYLGGVFDRHPSLRLVLCHPGAIPSLLPRIENLLSSIPIADKPKRSYLDVWQHNIYLSTADVQEMSSLKALLEQIPMDRVLYASNYPLEERGRALMDELRESGFLSKEEWERVAWGNAETLFGLKKSAGTKEEGRRKKSLEIPGVMVTYSAT
ncbi:hypothetical protein J1614_009110 [Plenodomus biglobosus]|nr:hypothetical protein J1614_009110 [Plenodomus biglobosus]